MDVVFRRGGLLRRPAGALVVGVFERERRLAGAAAAVDRAARGAVSALLRRRDFTGAAASVAVLYPAGLRADRLVLISEELIPTVTALGGDRERMVVNPNGVDVARFRPESRGEGLRERLGFPEDAVVCGFLATFHRWHAVNTRDLMRALEATAPASWGLSPASVQGPAAGGMLPMGLSVGPAAGPNWVLVGDAAGAINPFNGEGIAYALETGRLAAARGHQALVEGDPGRLQAYRRDLEDRFGTYYRTGRLFMEALGRPGVMRALTRVGFRSRSLMEWTLRVMSNLLDPAERSAGGAAYRLLERLVRTAPGG